MECLQKKLERNKQWIFFALAATFIWGLAAHGYGFMQNSFSHDSLNEFNGIDGSNDWKIQLGRYVVPFYRAVFHTELTLPWLIGVLSLIWIGFAVFFVIRIFKIESKVLAFVIAGIFTANITVAATAATYMHDYDGNIFAMLCVVAAVFLWQRYSWGFVAGAILVAVSLGIYQSYICTAITLVLFVCILDLMNEEDFKTVFTRGLKAVCMLILGGILYYIVLQIVLGVTGIPLSSGDYNSLDAALELTPGAIISLTFYAYADVWRRLLNVLSPYSTELVKGITLLLTATVLAALAVGLWNKRVRWLEKLLCIFLVCLIPLGMHITYILTFGIVHDLMVYAIWLFYLLALLMADWLVKRMPESMTKAKKILRPAAMALVLVLLYGNVQTANALYLKKDMEKDAFLSLMTRVVYKMEDFDAYEPGATPVVFVGIPEQQEAVIPGFEKYQAVTGADQPQSIDMRVNYRAQRYFRYVLSNPAIMAENDVWNAMQADSRVQEMPSYPDDGCVELLDDVLVVKLGSNS